MEVDCALQNDSVHLTLNDILSSEDEWFGVKFDTSALKETKQDIQRQLDERLQQLPRTQRRKLRSQLDLSKARSRSLIRQMIKENLPKPGTSDDPLLDLIDQELLIGWFLNEKSNADLQQHFCELISDPYILFAHVVDRIGH
ncbi:hypothetical protein HUU61_06215 [Rhodopseudomonas palustris]|nr:hypothetical protein [Rhodopseudomonas palustris]